MRALLYYLAKRLYRTPVSQPKEHQEALQDRTAYNAYRRAQLNRVLDVAKRYDVPLKDQVVLDFGCNDGSITEGYMDEAGARDVHGKDVDVAMVEQGNARIQTKGVPNVMLHTSMQDFHDNEFDTVVSFDCFEHVEDPAKELVQLYRVLKPRRKALIGTWGWGYPYAPHLFSVMPVPWAHVFWSEKTLLASRTRCICLTGTYRTCTIKTNRGKRFPISMPDRRSCHGAILINMLLLTLSVPFAKQASAVPPTLSRLDPRSF